MTTSELKNSIDEIYSYFDDGKNEVRKMALNLLSGLTVDNIEALEVFSSKPEKYLTTLFKKLSDEPSIAALSWDSLVNLAIEPKLALYMIDNHLDKVLSAVKSRELIFAEAATKLLANLTKQAEARPLIMAPLVVDLFPIYMAGSRHNQHCTYEFLACALADLSNVREGRLFFLRDLRKLADILPDIHSSSVIRRGAIASIIKNCLFEVDFHEAILEKEVEDDFIITALAGRLLDARSNLSKEEKEKLPVELQLLENLQAEGDLVVRSIVIECLIILGTTRIGRDTIKTKEIYPILREWHIIEGDYDLKNLVEKIVELLIRDEETTN